MALQATPQLLETKAIRVVGQAISSWAAEDMPYTKRMHTRNHKQLSREMDLNMQAQSKPNLSFWQKNNLALERGYIWKRQWGNDLVFPTTKGEGALTVVPYVINGITQPVVSSVKYLGSAWKVASKTERSIFKKSFIDEQKLQPLWSIRDNLSPFSKTTPNASVNYFSGKSTIDLNGKKIIVGQIPMKQLSGTSNVANKILEKVRVKNKENLTHKIFSFLQNEHGGGNIGKGFEKYRKSATTGLKDLINDKNSPKNVSLYEMYKKGLIEREKLRTYPFSPDLLKNAQISKKGTGLIVDNDTLQIIGKSEAKKTDFSQFIKEIVSTKEATWTIIQEGRYVKTKTGGIEQIIKYTDPQTGLTRFKIHKVTDSYGNVVHQDFDSVRIKDGQYISKKKMK